MSSGLPAPRRIITAHDDKGVAVIKEDKTIALFDVAPGLKVAPLWVTNSVPAKDNNLDDDGGLRPRTREGGLVSENGTNFTVTDLEPGGWTPWHRSSSVDHNIILNGPVILKMEDGEKVMNAGDIAIQRGTMHAWHNPGPEWARWACVLVDAEPAIVNGQPLEGAVKGTPAS